MRDKEPGEAQFVNSIVAEYGENHRAWWEQQAKRLVPGDSCMVRRGGVFDTPEAAAHVRRMMMTDTEKKLAAAVGEMQRYMYDLGFAPHRHTDFTGFHLEQCHHFWMRKFRIPDNASSPHIREVVTVCELCGAEKRDE